MSWEINVKTFAFEGQTIIEDFYAQLEPGATLGLIGPSGCGKSTLLNLIAGLRECHTWSCTIPTDKLTYIFQEPRLLPWLTVQDNILLVAPHAQSLCIELLAELGLSQYRTHYPNTLSGGMQRRVAIARAFITQPQILLLDEPFVSLDQPTATACRDLLKTLMERFATSAIFVTHDPYEAVSICDDILFLSSDPMRIIQHLKIAPGSTAENNMNVFKQLLQLHPALLTGSLHTI